MIKETKNQEKIAILNAYVPKTMEQNLTKVCKIMNQKERIGSRNRHIQNYHEKL